jgi:hypothetical protein
MKKMGDFREIVHLQGSCRAGIALIRLRMWLLHSTTCDGDEETRAQEGVVGTL